QEGGVSPHEHPRQFRVVKRGRVFAWNGYAATNQIILREGRCVAEHAVAHVIESDQLPRGEHFLVLILHTVNGWLGSASVSISTRAGRASRSLIATRASAAWSATGGQGCLKPSSNICRYSAVGRSSKDWTACSRT